MDKKIYKFKSVVDEGDEKVRMIILEDRGDRVLVREFVEGATYHKGHIFSTRNVLKSEIEEAETNDLNIKIEGDKTMKTINENPIEVKKFNGYTYEVFDKSVLEIYDDECQGQIYFKCENCGDITHRDDTNIAYGEGYCPKCEEVYNELYND